MRIQPITDAEAGAVAKDVFASSNELLGRTANLTRILAHSPYLGRWFLALTTAVRQPNAGAVSPVRLRNLAILKTSLLNRCQYCTEHNRVFGEGFGLTTAEFDALEGDRYQESPLFDEKDKAVVRWAEAITLNTARRDQAAWNEMRRLFSDAEIVEISLAAAMFNMTNRLNEAFWTELEPEEYNRLQGKALGVDVKSLEKYACRICGGHAAKTA